MSEFDTKEYYQNQYFLARNRADREAARADAETRRAEKAETRADVMADRYLSLLIGYPFLTWVVLMIWWPW